MADRILVVDDDRMSLKMAERVFRKAGVEGTYLNSGKEITEYLGNEALPDLILLDVHMPDINGFDILEKLKAEPRYKDVPVVFLTGDEDVKTETAGLNAGAADFIRKPFSAEVLLKRVNNIIELSRLHRDMAVRSGSKRRNCRALTCRSFRRSRHPWMQKTSIRTVIRHASPGIRKRSPAVRDTVRKSRTGFI